MTDVLAAQPLLAIEAIGGDRHGDLLGAAPSRGSGESCLRCRGISDSTEEGLSDIEGHRSTPSSIASLSAGYQQLLPAAIEGTTTTANAASVPLSAVAAGSQAGTEPLAVLTEPGSAAEASATVTPSDAHTVDGVGTAHVPAAGSAQSSNHFFDCNFLAPVLLRVLRGHPADVDGAHETQTRRLMCRLRRQLSISACFFCLHSAVIVVCLLKSFSTLAEAKGEQCSGLVRTWLFILLGMQLSGPLSVLIAALGRCCLGPLVVRGLLLFTWPCMLIILLIWCIAPIYMASDCPAFRKIGFQAFMLQIMSNFLLLMSLVYVMSARPNIIRLSSIITRSAFSLDMIAKVPAVELPNREECVICLGCEEDEEAPTQGQEEDAEVKARPPWRRLECGHVFHEQCLFTWLRKTKRCPVCRRQVKKVKKRVQDPAAQSGSVAVEVASREEQGTQTDASRHSPALELSPGTDRVVLTVGSPNE
mmetsp:Transcript_36201/g.63777  ORF Transcript_36201/g.63777 Transcript_36201/m.63777 type:complete len:475 (-) Transcript_36201:60-1484(-)